MPYKLYSVLFGFHFFCYFSVHFYPQWDTADAEIKVPSAEYPAQTNALLLNPGVGQNTATHALQFLPCLYFCLPGLFTVISSLSLFLPSRSIHRQFFPVFISAFQVYSPSFLPCLYFCLPGLFTVISSLSLFLPSRSIHRHFFPVFISAFQVYSPSFLPYSFPTLYRCSCGEYLGNINTTGRWN